MAALAGGLATSVTVPAPGICRDLDIGASYAS
jgi:hypothetical protein